MSTFVIVALAVPVLATHAQGQTIWHVDDNAPLGGDGTGWNTAYKYLQDALAAATAGDEIHVGGGTYNPDRDESGNVAPGDRTETFQLLGAVALYGGYAGLANSGSPDARDIEAYRAVLSGDLAGDDGPDFQNNDENVYHVVTGSGVNTTALIDGFIITGGHANGGYPHASGAGVYNYGGSPTVRRCTIMGNWADMVGAAMYNGVGSDPEVSDCAFRDNKAASGGGMYNWDSNPELTGCTFSGNRTTTRGGGLYNWESDPTLVDCTFIDNLASSGGGIANYERSSPTLTDCTFVDNHVHWSGGGMFNSGDSSPTLVNCIFDDNWGPEGAGMRNNDSSPELSHCIFSKNTAYAKGGGAMYNDHGSPTLSSCTFRGNEASFIAGGMYNDDDSNPLLTDCTFIGNTAFLGGAMYNKESSPILAGCSFKKNTAEDDGGAIYNDDGGPKIANCIFAGNSAYAGGGVLNFGASRADLVNCTFVNNTAYYGGGMYSFEAYHTGVNCVFWGNTDSNGSGESAQLDGAWSLITYCCIQGWMNWPWGVGNHGDDPLFVPGPAGCYYLSQTGAGQAVNSPCIDAGSNTAAYFELDTRTTRSDEVADTGIVDMGYHYPVTGEPLVMGDLDHDIDVDLADFAGLQNCLTGEGPTDVTPCCRIFDFGPDADVDLDDFAVFKAVFQGPQ
jgi:predicted outer membrane repeat protein